MKEKINYLNILSEMMSLFKSVFRKRSQVFFFLFLWVGGYVFFLSSTLWIREDFGRLKFTPLYEKQMIGGRQVRLMNAIKDDEKHLVMIELEITNYRLLENMIDQLEIRDKNFQKVPYRVIYMDDGYFIFVVPASKRFTSIYVRGFYLNQKQELAPAFQIFVSKSKNLKEGSINLDRSKEEIYQDKQALEMTYVMEHIQRKEEEIKTKTKEYETLLALIDDFKKQEGDLTESERKVFRAELSKNETQSEGIQKEIVSLKKEKIELEEVKEKIEKRREKE